MNESLYPVNPILMVDDDKMFLKSASFFFKSNGINNFELLYSGKDVLNNVKKKNYAMIILDLNMPDSSGKEILISLTENFPEIPVVILTGEIKVDTAVECIKLGAYDYISKPIDKNRLITTIKNVMKFNDIKNEKELLLESFTDKKNNLFEDFTEIVTGNDKMKVIFKYINAVAQTDLPVLITGETGTGKELLANAIHNKSKRTGKFVKINISAEDPALISDTLFGHLKGSYTGSTDNRKGLIEQADKGTLFLDEIGDLDPVCQLKLLRVLQERKYYPIGSDIEKNCNVRFLFATNQDLKYLIEENKLRKDFYYRLQSHKVSLPPLRERLDDIKILVDHFIQKACASLNKKEPHYPEELLVILKNYKYPGNVRELEGLIFDAISLHEKGILSLNTFYEKLDLNNSGDSKENINDKYVTEGDKVFINSEKFMTLKEMQDFWIKEALNRTDGNQTLAAKLLGISRRALNNRLNRKI